ncbi:MAG TPA: hypothetical protein VFV67_34045 [Actinophytocola sp.]|uniref:hypothetical protein n=1 Tax=Actinophytocola sp. TaxID=1872138 RepID=UPI002DBA1FB2|nr:hypothetical protein [Actinophytocola sp.]HEU5475690.1 hypothetical protein [Actinophytocola sp.]
MQIGRRAAAVGVFMGVATGFQVAAGFTGTPNLWQSSCLIGAVGAAVIAAVIASPKRKAGRQPSVKQLQSVSIVCTVVIVTAMTSAGLASPKEKTAGAHDYHVRPILAVLVSAGEVNTHSKKIPRCQVDKRSLAPA